jgi:hypothetical protein
MKNLIPYNLFEMSKLNIQDYIKDIEHIRDSVDYFNSKYKEIELNNKFFNVDFKMPGNNFYSPRLFGITAEVDDDEYHIMSLIIKQTPNDTYISSNVTHVKKRDDVAYYLIVDTDCNLNIYYRVHIKGNFKVIFLEKISINLLKDKDKLIKIVFDRIKNHNESLNEMAKYENDEIVKDIKSFMQYAKNHENSIKNKLNVDVIFIYYFFLKIDLENIIEIIHNDNTDRRMLDYKVSRKNGIKKSETFRLEINYSYNGIIFRMIIENENNGERWIEQEKVLPYITIKNESKLMDKFIDWCNEFLYDEQ